MASTRKANMIFFYSLQGANPAEDLNVLLFLSMCIAAVEGTAASWLYIINQKTSNGCWGTWGPFYVIGRFSFFAADTLRRRRRKKKTIPKAQHNFISQGAWEVTSDWWILKQFWIFRSPVELAHLFTFWDTQPGADGCCPKLNQQALKYGETAFEWY